MIFDSYADYVLSDNMAETPARVYGLLDQIWKPEMHHVVEMREQEETIAAADESGDPPVGAGEV